MARNFLACLVLVLSILAACGAVFAHHASGSAYDYKTRIVTKAVVTEVVWTNPHAQLFFDIKDNKGQVANWGVELNSPGNLIKLGWTKNTFNPATKSLCNLCPPKKRDLLESAAIS